LASATPPEPRRRSTLATPHHPKRPPTAQLGSGAPPCRRRRRPNSGDAPPYAAPHLPRDVDLLPTRPAPHHPSVAAPFPRFAPNPGAAQLSRCRTAFPRRTTRRRSPPPGAPAAAPSYRRDLLVFFPLAGFAGLIYGFNQKLFLCESFKVNDQYSAVQAEKSN